MPPAAEAGCSPGTTDYFLVLTHVAGKLVPMSFSREFLGCTWGLHALPAAFLRAAPNSSHRGGALTGIDIL